MVQKLKAWLRFFHRQTNRQVDRQTGQLLYAPKIKDFGGIGAISCKIRGPDNKLLYFSTKPYNVTIRKNRLEELQPEYDPFTHPYLDPCKISILLMRLSWKVWNPILSARPRPLFTLSCNYLNVSRSTVFEKKQAKQTNIQTKNPFCFIVVVDIADFAVLLLFYLHNRSDSLMIRVSTLWCLFIFYIDSRK